WLSLSTIAACLFPPLIFNSLTGFSTTLFAASILWAGAFLICRREDIRGGIGWSILALIPPIGLEGLWIVFLIWAFWSSPRLSSFPREGWLSSVRASVFRGVALTIPTLLLSLFRVRSFGSFIPVPVRYKFSSGSGLFFKLGVTNFLADLYAAHTLQLIGLLGL